jgi:ubiquitin carboxyl-terminal hydrolase 9/24
VCVSEQKDAFEFFSLLTEKLEKYLKKSPYSGLYKSTFEGVLSNQLICQGCPHSSERDEPFLGLNIEVKNKKHLLEGFIFIFN